MIHIFFVCILLWAGIAQSVEQQATAWTVRGPNRGGARFSAPVQNGPGAHPTSHTMGTRSLLGVRRPERGVNHPLHLASKLKKE